MKRIIYLCIYLLVLILPIHNLRGQVLHYSQFFSSPLQLNPALTGIIDSDWRYINNYRTQGLYYGNPIHTISVSLDKSFVFYKNIIGVGFLYNFDNSAGSYLPVNRMYVSGASLVQISDKSYLGGGIQIGWVTKRFTYGNLTFPEQYDRSTGGFNNSLPLSENFQENSTNYLDVNIGVLWNYKNERMVISSGIALYHLNQPKDFFIEENNTIKVRTNGHASLKYQLNEVFYILPQTYYTFQNKAKEFLLGSNIGININSPNQDFRSISAGIYIRNGFANDLESAIVLLGLNYRNWNVISSFDIDISGLKTQNIFANAFELSLIYERPYAILKKKTIPCIRY